ncbi:MAG: DUF2793 domain-containing protein [Pseudomonadota bacterium]
MNEALLRLDATGAAVVEAVGLDTPPVGPVEGGVWAVGSAPTGEWAGQAGALAYAVGGGWAFVAPSVGRRVNLADGSEHAYDGNDWVAGRVAGAAGGAATVMRVLEVDHVVAAGTASTVAAAIPSGAVVIGVSGRVTEALSGPASWRLGVAGSDNRYGQGLGVAAGSFVSGLTGSPLAYYADTDLVMTSDGGDFVSGRVLLAVHLIEILPPAPL